MALDRMAEERIRAHKILPIYFAGENIAEVSGENCETPLDHRTRLLGLGHYEGRGWRGFHHHATLCIAAYGFLISERNRFSPSVRVGHVGLSAPEPPPDFRPRGSPR